MWADGTWKAGTWLAGLWAQYDAVTTPPQCDPVQDVCTGAGLFRPIRGVTADCVANRLSSRFDSRFDAAGVRTSLAAWADYTAGFRVPTRFEAGSASCGVNIYASVVRTTTSVAKITTKAGCSTEFIDGRVGSSASEAHASSGCYADIDSYSCYALYGRVTDPSAIQNPTEEMMMLL